MRISVITAAIVATSTMLLAECRVALDIGHDPKRFGAVSSTGIPEYRFNRRAALMTYRYLLQKGVDAFFINSQEGPISLAERSSRALKYGGNLLVSFHHDSVQPKFLTAWTAPDGSTQRYCNRFKGYTVFVSRKNRRFKESMLLAKEIGGQIKRCLHPLLRLSRHAYQARAKGSFGQRGKCLCL